MSGSKISGSTATVSEPAGAPGEGDAAAAAKGGIPSNFDEQINSGPCQLCQLPLRKGCLIAAAVGLVYGLVYIIASSITLALLPNATDIAVEKNGTGKAYTVANALEYTAMLNVVRGFFAVMLFIVLGAGAYTRNRCLCVTWIWAHLIFMIAKVLASFLIALACGHAYIPLLPLVLTAFLEIYFLWVVLAYAHQLRFDPNSYRNKHLSPQDRAKKDKEAEAEMLTMGIYGYGTESGAAPGPDGYPVHPVVAAMRKEKEQGGQGQGSEAKIQGSEVKFAGSGEIRKGRGSGGSLQTVTSASSFKDARPTHPAGATRARLSVDRSDRKSIMEKMK